MSRWLRSLSVVPLVTLAGCVGLVAAPTPQPGWIRDKLPYPTGSCFSECKYTIGRGDARIEARTRVQRYAPHQIPGWERGIPARLMSWLGQETISRLGGQSKRTTVSFGTSTISDRRPDSWRLECSLFGIMDTVIERQGGDDEPVGFRRRTAGMQCTLVSALDSSVVRWRLRSGITPPRDSLAAVYDSLVAAGSPAVAPVPPMVIERLRPDGSVQDRFDVVVDSTQRFNALWRIKRADGTGLATIHAAQRTTLDYAPDTTEEVRRLVRLLGVALALRDI